MQELYFEEEMPISTEKRDKIAEIQDKMIEQGKSPEQVKARLEEEFDENYSNLIKKAIKFDKKHLEAVNEAVENSDIMPDDEKEDFNQMMERTRTKIEFLEKTHDIDQGEKE